MNAHARFLKLGLDTNSIVATKLLNTYIISQSPNSLIYGYQLFEQVAHKDITLWTSIISAFNKAGESYKALKLFSQMLHQTQPNHFIYSTVARACGSSIAHTQLGKSVHSRIIRTGCLPNVIVETSLLDMYAKYGLIECSIEVFNQMPERNVISWNAMIAAYILNGKEDDGFELFYQMKCAEYIKPDEFTFATILTGCACIKEIKLGMQVHASLMVGGLEKGCASGVCNMYLRCGEISSAERIMRETKENSLLKRMMIKGYIFNQRYHDAVSFIANDNHSVNLFLKDRSVIVSVLTACADLSLLRIGRQVHGIIITMLGFDYNFQSNEEDFNIIISALIDMYCKCSSMEDAGCIFDNQMGVQHVSHWNALITGYIHNGLLNDAILCFRRMPERNVVSWTTMVSGYVHSGLPQEGLNVLSEMYSNENGVAVQGNSVTFAVALEASSTLTALEAGKQIHAKVMRAITKADICNVVVGTALVDMYSKSGNLIYAKTVFDRMMEKNVVSWTSMITGYANHGLGLQALELFRQMLSMDIEPNEVTFVSVLTSCSHSGLVEEGIKYFKLMAGKYRIYPGSDHYACMVDLLGRAGKLHEALSLLEEIDDWESSTELSGAAMWGALLGACSLYGNVELGNLVAQKMLEKKQQVSETYISLSNVYAAAEMWDEACRVRENWRKGGVDVDFGKEQIKVQLDNLGNMKVSGERHLEGDKWSRFYLNFRIPKDCNFSDIQAKFMNNVLAVVLPKRTIWKSALPPQTQEQKLPTMPAEKMSERAGGVNDSNAKSETTGVEKANMETKNVRQIQESYEVGMGEYVLRLSKPRREVVNVAVAIMMVVVAGGYSVYRLSQ